MVDTIFQESGGGADNDQEDQRVFGRSFPRTSCPEERWYGEEYEWISRGGLRDIQHSARWGRFFFYSNVRKVEKRAQCGWLWLTVRLIFVCLRSIIADVFL